MANIKELLPILAAGLAGAASPQGAQVFNQIAAQDTARKERSADRAAQDERLGMAREELGMRRSAEQRAIRVSDLAMADREKKEIETEKERQKAEAARGRVLEYVGKHSPDGVPIVADLIDGMDDPEKMFGIADSFLGRERKPGEQEAELKALAEQTGAVYRGERPDGTTFQVGPTEKEKTEPLPVTDMKAIYGSLDKPKMEIAKLGVTVRQLGTQAAMAEKDLNKKIAQRVATPEDSKAVSDIMTEAEMAKVEREQLIMSMVREVAANNRLTDEVKQRTIMQYLSEAGVSQDEIGRIIGQPEQQPAADQTVNSHQPGSVGAERAKARYGPK